MRGVHASARAALALVALLASVGSVDAGGPKRDCWAELRSGAGRIRRDVLTCRDGQPRCDEDGDVDGACDFSLRVCANRTTGGRCKARTVQRIRVTGADLALPVLPTSDSRCGPETTVRVPAGTARRVNLVTRVRHHARPDRDTLLLQCDPPTVCDPFCTWNTAGPRELQLVTRGPGADLDLGWAPTGHDFPVPDDIRLRLCLGGCDTRTNPLCTARPFTRDCDNLPAFVVPPIPLLAAGVPICLVTRFGSDDVAGLANVQTGDLDLPLPVLSEVLLTDLTNVCPRCIAGRCNSGPRAGKSCSVDAVITVVDAASADKVFGVSKACPPPTDLDAGTISLSLHLTTGASVLGPSPGGSAETPCVAQAGEPTGLPPRPDWCPLDGTCTATCEGTACATTGLDYVTGLPACVDRRGGLAQSCCSNSTSSSCFPTGPGSDGRITRVGSARAPEPRWPDASYPKAGDCAPGQCTVLAATFCLDATGTGSVDGLLGLPGPGALLLPVTQLWSGPAAASAPAR